MENNIKKIEKLLDLNDIYNEYSYLNIDRDTFDNMIHEEILNITANSDLKNDEIIKKLKRTLNQKTKLLLKDDTKMMPIINSYCNLLTISHIYSENYEELKKLCDFLNDNDILINIDFCLSILNNNSANELVKNIVERNIKNIREGKIQYVIDNVDINMFIQAYCLLNDIEIGRLDFDDSIDKYYYTDSLRAYLSDIGKKPLLTHDDEISLANRVRSGDINAKNEFIEANLRLVVSIAKRYFSSSVSFLDLIEEGNIGLMTAIDKYDPSLGVRFSSYAVHWIRQAITRYLQKNSSPINISYQAHEKLRSLKKQINEINKDLNYTPTNYEIADKLNIPITELESYQILLNKPVSLNSLIGEDDTEYLDLVPSDDKSVVQNFIDMDLKNDIQLAFDLAGLTERERVILNNRYGLNSLQAVTFVEIAKLFNVSNERIRQIEISALCKIRKSREAIEILSKYSFNPSSDYKNMERFFKVERDVNYYEKKKKRKK